MRGSGVARPAPLLSPVAQLLGSACGGKRTTPPFLPFLLPPPAHTVVLESPWPRCLSTPHPLPPFSAFAHRLGRGATPLHPPDGRPANGRLLPPFLPRSGSLPARASGASDPCGKASGRRLQRVQAEVSKTSVGGAVLDGDAEAGRQLAHAAHGLVGRLPSVGEPEGLRRLVEDDLLRLGEVGSDHSGAPLRRARAGAGVRGLRPGLRPRSSVAPAAAQEARGSRGAQHPLASPSVYTLGMLAPRA